MTGVAYSRQKLEGYGKEHYNKRRGSLGIIVLMMIFIGRDIEITNAEMETKYERLLSSYRIEERE